MWVCTAKYSQNHCAPCLKTVCLIDLDEEEAVRTVLETPPTDTVKVNVDELKSLNGLYFFKSIAYSQ